jgi:ABC-type phosphate/phosphonate transport system permease subunit
VEVALVVSGYLLIGFVVGGLWGQLVGYGLDPVPQAGLATVFWPAVLLMLVFILFAVLVFDVLGTSLRRRFGRFFAWWYGING